MFSSEFRIKNMEYSSTQKFTDLKVWQHCHNLVLKTYSLTSTFPKSEIFGICSQMRRAALSTTSNIAEGYGRTSYLEKLQFYKIARGSIFELTNQYIASKDLNFINQNQYKQISVQLENCTKLLQGIIRSTNIKSKIPKKLDSKFKILDSKLS